MGQGGEKASARGFSPSRSQGDRAAKERERPLQLPVLCMKYLDSRADELSPPFAEV